MKKKKQQKLVGYKFFFWFGEGKEKGGKRGGRGEGRWT